MLLWVSLPQWNIPFANSIAIYPPIMPFNNPNVRMLIDIVCCLIAASFIDLMGLVLLQTVNQ